MINNISESKVIWAQIDGNLHLRHSAYADLAAQARVEILERIGLDLKTLAALKIGPVLFREELVYLKEIGLNEEISVKTYLTSKRPDASRWSFRQEIYRADEQKAAVVSVDGAWLNLERRKLTALPEALIDKFSALPTSENFREEVPSRDTSGKRTS